MRKLVHIQAGFTVFTLGVYFLLLWLTGQPLIAVVIPFGILLVVFGTDFGVVFFIAGVVGLAVAQLVSDTIGVFIAVALYTTMTSTIFGLLESDSKRPWSALVFAVLQCSFIFLFLLWSMPAN